MSRRAKAAWLNAGFRAIRKRLVRERSKLYLRKAVAEDVRERGYAAYSAIIAELDTQMRDLEFGWEPGPVTAEVKS